MRIAFTTLGCKINQYETDAMRKAAAAEGNAIVPFESEADVYVINTCSVTAKSDYHCRQTIRAAIRRKEGARVIVTGCYAETRPQEIRSIPGVSLVLGNDEKANIARYVSDPEHAGVSRASGYNERLRERTRGVLKIQDGCDSRCSYCIVPQARGGSRSVPWEEVVKLFVQAVEAGCPEVVLSGIHIGRYGSDLDPRVSFTGLVADLLAGRKHTRIRLSSIEPNEITDELLDLFGQGMCRHFHIPLQSGDDAILRSMNRDYTAAFYRNLVENIARKVPGVAIGADVMVGFPGEDENAFLNTFNLIEELPLTHLHVFSYSPRPGTTAAIMKGQVSTTIKKQRNEALRDLGLKKNLEFRNRFKGSILNVVLEESSRSDEGEGSGLTDNYIRVTVSGVTRGDFGKEISVLINDIRENDVIGIKSASD
jgi:threonylcarbamoyladenosine tRNA methylthiotransferase MtaB